MLNKDIHLESLYTELPFENRFTAAKADGFTAIELWSWDNKDLPGVRRLLEENGLALAAMSGDGPLSMCDPVNKVPYIAYIRQAISAAQVVGCKTLVIHSDSLEDWPQYAKPMSGNYSDITRYCAMFDVLREITPLAEEAGITFVLEALNIEKDHCGNFLNTTGQSVDLVRAINSPNLKILYDAYHMYLDEGKICETTEKYLPWIGHIHIADAPGRNEPGTGVINFRNFLAHLDRIGYESFVGFELYARNHTSEAVQAIKACW